MRNIYLFTKDYPPTRGGLEAWTHALASRLAMAGNRVIVCFCSHRESLRYCQILDLDGINVMQVVRRNDIWKAPLSYLEGSLRYSRELARFDFLDAKRALISDLRQSEYDGVIISNFLSGVAFLAGLVAEALNLAHVPCVVGTDFSRGFYNSSERFVIHEVASSAATIVAMNCDQRSALSKRFPTCPIEVIHSSISTDILTYKWAHQQQKTIELFFDGGYSSKKGTQVVIWACEILLSEGLPIRLTICGATNAFEEDYWREERLRLSGGGAEIVFLDWVDRGATWQQIIRSSIYCAPTIGEGCSLARLAALCTGIPIVTSGNAEMADLARSLKHVHLVQPGDEEAFLSALRVMCLNLLGSHVITDEDALVAIRKYVTDSDRELRQWLAVLDSAKVVHGTRPVV